MTELVYGFAFALLILLGSLLLAAVFVVAVVRMDEILEIFDALMEKLWRER